MGPMQEVVMVLVQATMSNISSHVNHVAKVAVSMPGLTMVNCVALLLLMSE